MSASTHPETGEPAEPPPPYEVDAKPRKTRSGITPMRRRSMEDEARPLPRGWVRQYDQKEHHQFFVDTNVDPPRSIWHHPYDDKVYLDSLTSEERTKIKNMHQQPTAADLEVESSDDEAHHDRHEPEASTSSAAAARGKANEDKPSGASKLGRKIKDKLTGSTHAEREAKRAKRAEEERRAYEQHQAFRRAMVKAMETGEPQLVGKDRNGQDVYVEPPPSNYGGGYGDPYDNGYGYGGYRGGGCGNGYGYNPYQQGVYGYPNGRYLRPAAPYGRPYGYGYGGGFGLPLLGGLAGGALLGGLLLS